MRLADFRGRRNVLLVFHPFAFTPVCEEEARDLQENLPSFESAETDVVLVSCDSAAARQAWKEQLKLTYTLASDFWPHGEAAKAYGVFDESSGAAVRGTFLIDKDGVVVWSLVNDADTRRERARLGPAGLLAFLSLARYEWGDASLPPLVCLHGVTSHGRHFEQLAERLADRFHVVALDLRGHGGSPWEPPWNLEQHVADVLDAAPAGRCRLARPLVRRARRLRDGCCGAGPRRAARAARPGDPAPAARRHCRRRERAS